MRKHTQNNIKDSHTPAWSYYFMFGMFVIGMLGLLLIPSCMQAQSKEGTTISKGEQHER